MGTLMPSNDHKTAFTALNEVVAPLTNTTLFEPSRNEGFDVAQQWLLSLTHGHVPPGQGSVVIAAHPPLNLSPIYDSVCPLVSARESQGAFMGPQMLVWRGT